MAYMRWGHLGYVGVMLPPELPKYGWLLEKQLKSMAYMGWGHVGMWGYVTPRLAKRWMDGCM